MAVQTKGSQAICSSIGDIKKHEEFKKLNKTQRIEKLQETYDEYGVYSNEFFIQVKPFIMWTIFKNLRGMPASMYLEDLVNNAYEELIIAFNGGNTTHYNEPVYKEPIYGTDRYYEKYNNIGQFVMEIVGSSVSKYRSKTYRRMITHEDDSEDISEKINYTDFEVNHNLDYTMKDVEESPFKFFKFNDKLTEHLNMIRETKPRNNVIYNFMLWRERN